MDNHYLTYCAQAKILQMLKNASAVGLNLVSDNGTLQLQFIFAKHQACDIMISTTPSIYTDQSTLSRLKNGCVDFSYSQSGGEFIISRL